MFKKLFANIYFRNILVLSTILLTQYLIDTTSSSGETRKQRNALMNSFFLALTYGYMIIHNKILFEKFLNKKKFIIYILLFVTLLVADYYLTKFVIHVWTGEKMEVGYSFGRTIFIYLGFAVYTSYKFFTQQSKLNELMALQRENELNQLKAQLNPHFLYNALNNIYSYLLVNNDASGKELILKLSELMRYLTEDSNKDAVTLEEGVKFVQNYIAFEEERLGKRCTINFSAEISDSQITMAPHIIFPLIENAFKHGTNSINPVSIDIKMKLENKIFTLKVTNGIYPTSNKKSTHKGIQNVRRRLEILYPDKFSLGITNNTITHVVDLKIDLS